MDETGIRIGISKRQAVYTQHGRDVLVPTSNNRELVSLVECISASGHSIAPMIIVKGKSILDYWATDLPDDYFINTTSSGYSTDLTAFHWIQHFEKQTKARTKGLWRLLLLDGHGSHDTREFLEYCELHRILAVALPPHTTHLLQPLDVGCFQPLKWYHGKTLDWAARTGAKEITKDDFFATLDEIRRQTFTYNTI